MRSKKMRKLFHDRRAVSVVISNVILVGAVIVLGFAVLMWGRYQASTYNNTFTQTMNSDIATLKEKLTFENAFYIGTAQNVTVYLLNSGTQSDITIKAVSVKNLVTNSYVLWANSTGPVVLRYYNGTRMPNQRLNVAQEGYFTLHLTSSLSAGTRYSIIITTVRGSSFASGYVA